MTMRDALDEAMRQQNVDDAMPVLIEREVWMTDVDSLTTAIHGVYCGIMADHAEPNEKDRAQARAMLDNIRQSTAA